MVRPIEITDALSKSTEVGRLQQNVQTRPEVAQEFQKSLNEKTHVQQVNMPNPTPQTDLVVLHADEREKEKRKTPEEQEEELEKKNRDKDHENSKEHHPTPPEDGSPGHIDIKV